MQAASSPSLRRRPVPVQRPRKPETPPAKAAVGSKYFGMQAPRGDRNIAKEKRRPGLSKGPVKQQPKPKFSTKAISQKPGQAEAEAAAAKKAKSHDSALITWLKAGHANRPETQEERNYLLRGPPFLGLHDYERKEAVRDAGAVWNKNPQKEEMCTDKSIRFGWYGAPNERVLEALLELEPREKEARHGGGTYPCYPFHPLATGSRVGRVVDTMLQILREHAHYAERKDRSEREAAQAAQEKREGLQREKDRMAGRTADGDAEIARLKDVYGVKWCPALAKVARAAPLLGPTIGLSEVERVLRGLEMGIVEATDVRAHKFVDHIRSGGVSKAGPSSAAADDGAPSKDFNREPGDASVLLFGKKHPWMMKLPTDSEWEKARLAQYREEPPGRSSVRPLKTRCLNCSIVVMCQFPWCSTECEESRDERVGLWSQCLACGAMRCDPAPFFLNSAPLQGCICDDKEGWHTNQQAAEAAVAAAVAPLTEEADDDDDDDDDDPSVGGLVGVVPIASDGSDDFVDDAPVGMTGMMDAWLDNE